MPGPLCIRESMATPPPHTSRDYAADLARLFAGLLSLSMVEYEVHDRICVQKQSVAQVAEEMDRPAAWVECVLERARGKLGPIEAPLS